jgi:hypothetical protein
MVRRWAGGGMQRGMVDGEWLMVHGDISQKDNLCRERCRICLPRPAECGGRRRAWQSRPTECGNLELGRARQPWRAAECGGRRRAWQSRPTECGNLELGRARQPWRAAECGGRRRAWQSRPTECGASGPRLALLTLNAAGTAASTFQ